MKYSGKEREIVGEEMAEKNQKEGRWEGGGEVDKCIKENKMKFKEGWTDKRDG